MKRHLITLCIAAILSSSAAHAGLFDWGPKDMDLSYLTFVPSSADYTGDFGIEARIRKWSWDEYGWMSNLGLHQWSYDGVPSYVRSNIAGAESIDGTIGFLVFGLGGFYGPINDDYKSLTLDAGVRMHVGLTEATIRSRPSTRGEISSEITLASNLMAFVGVDATYKPRNWPELLIGAGYQQDIIQGDISVNDQTIGSMELSGAFFRVGIRTSL